MGANTCRSPRGRALMLLFASVCRGNCSCQLSSASSYPHKAGLPGSFSRGRRRAAARPGTAPSIRGPAPRGVSSAPSPPRAGEGLHGLVSADRPTAAGQDKTTRSVISCACSGPAGFALRAHIGLFHARVAADARLSLPQPQPQALPAARGTDDPELVLRLTNEARPPPFPKAFEPTTGGGVGFGAVLLKVTDVPPRAQRALPRCRRGARRLASPPPPGPASLRAATGGPPGPGGGAVPA